MSHGLVVEGGLHADLLDSLQDGQTRDSAWLADHVGVGRLDVARALRSMQSFGLVERALDRPTWTITTTGAEALAGRVAMFRPRGPLNDFQRRVFDLVARASGHTAREVAALVDAPLKRTSAALRALHVRGLLRFIRVQGRGCVWGPMPMEASCR